MNITINQVLQSYIDPLTASEYAALERSLLAEGCRDALVLWNDVLIDGHNRYAICRQHGIEFIKTILLLQQFYFRHNRRGGSFSKNFSHRLMAVGATVRTPPGRDECHVRSRPDSSMGDRSGI